jgi:uncharacterized protein YukE
MLVGGGGGSISVEPAVLDAASAKVAGIASSTSSVRGSLAGAVSAAAGCQDPAASSYARLQSVLADAMACLDECSTMLSQAVASGAQAYVATDNSQFVP